MPPRYVPPDAKMCKEEFFIAEDKIFAVFSPTVKHGIYEPSTGLGRLDAAIAAILLVSTSFKKLFYKRVQLCCVVKHSVTLTKS